MTPRLFGLAFLVQLSALGIFILQQLNAQPAPPPHLADDVQDVVFLGPQRPYLIRFHLDMDGKPFRTAYRNAWDSYVKTLFAFLDRDGNGRLSAKETERMPPPQLFLTAGLPGLGKSNINVAFNFSVVDDNSDGSVSLAELGEYYREYSNSPFRLQVDPRAPQPQLSTLMFNRLDKNNDGYLSAEEATAAATTLGSLDLDEDELITAQELTPGAGTPVGALAAPGLTSAPQRSSAYTDFLELDPTEPRSLVYYLTKKYGVGEQAIKANQMHLTAAEMAQLDTDKNGELSGNELVHFPELPPQMELSVHFVLDKSGNASWEAYPTSPLKASKTPYGSLMVTADKTRLELIHNDRVPERLPAGRDAYLNHFQDMDANNDGLLTRAEAQPSPFFSKLFNLLDRDENDMVTPKETMAYLSALQEGQFLALASRLQLLVSQPTGGLFDLLDRNQDSRLSTREMRDLTALLTTMDEDKDGKLSRDEFARTHRLALGISQASFNRFGGNLISLQPALPNQASVDLLRGGPVWFRKMDRNRDGDVSLREFVGSRKAFEKIDTDHDGLISAAEANQVTK